MKPLIFITALAVATPAMANERVTDVKVFDHSKTIVQYIPTTQYVCNDIKKPVYGNVRKQGNAAEGALAGMIIGGLLGKGVTGDDSGAAAGAIFGGLVGADKGAKPKDSKEIIGYEIVESCKEVTSNKKEYVEVYSHSTIRFFVNGRRYVLEFKK